MRMVSKPGQAASKSTCRVTRKSKCQQSQIGKQQKNDNGLEASRLQRHGPTEMRLPGNSSNVPIGIDAAVRCFQETSQAFERHIAAGNPPDSELVNLFWESGHIRALLRHKSLGLIAVFELDEAARKPCFVRAVNY
jgi:hypothetical protein